MARRIIGDQVERIRNFALVLENVDAASARYARGKLRLAPADVERRDYVIEKVGGDAARIIPVLAEAEEAIAIIGALRRRAEPRLPIDVVVALAVRTGL